MDIRMRFALDRNGDRQVQPEEVVSRLEDLASQDKDGDDVLKGRELKDVYFEYATDVWVPGGRPHRVDSDGVSCSVELRSLALKTGQVDVHANCRLSG